MNYFLDTHILVRRLLEPKRLPKRIKGLFLDGENNFLIPTMAVLEIQYLTEIGRIEVRMETVLEEIEEEQSFQLAPYDDAVMRHSLLLTTTRDPFDRIILAHALSRSTRIITQDRWMKETAPHLVVFD